MPTKVQQEKETSKDDLRKSLYLLVKGYEGAINEIANITGFHRETIRLTFLGRRKRSLNVVLEAASKVVRERRAAEQKAMQNVAAILAKADF